MVYLLALVFCLFPFEIKLDKYLINSLEIIDNFPKIELSGTFNLFLLFIILFLIIKYFETIKNKYLLGLMLVFLVNNNRLLFSPIYTVTFLDQTTPNMIQRKSGIFERKPLISKEI